MVKRITFILGRTSKMAFAKTEFHGWRYSPIKVDAHRNNWSKAKIICVCPDKNGDAQKPQLLVGSCSSTKIGLDRPINKNVLLVETEKVRFLNEETKTNQDGRVT